jgi:hypothetical protein
VDLTCPEIAFRRSQNVWLFRGIQAKQSIPVRRATFSRPSDEVALATKLTTERLDVLARRWTMRRQISAIQGQITHDWTILHSAPRAPQPQGAGAIAVPPAP